MHGRSAKRAAFVLAAALAGCAGPASSPPAASEATVQAHVDRASQLAGTDLRQLVRLCEPQPAERAQAGAQADDMLRKRIARPAPPPQQVFDNLYYVGGDWVSAWVLKTSAGLVLIDALNNPEEAQALIEGGMARLGLDPRQTVGPAGANPFVTGPAVVDRALHVMGECARAQSDRFRM